jgi:hypothetical protein
MAAVQRLGDVCMLVIQTGRAKRLRKYTVWMTVIMVVTGSFAGLLTLHWYALPPKK